MSADYWGYCLGVNGTRATFKHLRAYGESDARQAAISNWKYAYPDEPLKSVDVDYTETDYEMSAYRRIQ